MRIMDRDWTTIDDFSPPIGCQCVFWWNRNWHWVEFNDRPDAETLSWWCADHGWVSVDGEGRWACSARVRSSIAALPVERAGDAGQLSLFGAAA